MTRPSRAKVRRAAAHKRNHRARELLLAHLTPQQAHTYTLSGYFEVTVDSGLKYCLHRGSDSVIFRLDHYGRHLYQICTHITPVASPERYRQRCPCGCQGFIRWPIDDVMLAHLLMLRSRPRTVTNTAIARCYPYGHQRPDLRGPHFDPLWTRSPLPFDAELVRLGGSGQRDDEGFSDYEHALHKWRDMGEVRGLKAFWPEIRVPVLPEVDFKAMQKAFDDVARKWVPANVEPVKVDFKLLDQVDKVLRPPGP